MTIPTAITRLRPATKACLLILLLLALQAPGCGVDVPKPRVEGPRPRIISLSPALSQVLIDLGLTEHVVGRTPWAPAALDAAPVVGDLLAPDLERITAVRPDLIIVQPTQRGVDPGLRALAEGNGWGIAPWELNRLADLERVLDELPGVLAEQGVDGTRLEGVVAAWRTRRDELLAPTDAVVALGPTALLFGVDPPMVFGGDTYLDDLWTALGGENALDRSGYVECSLEDLVVLRPPSVIVIANGPEQAGDGVERLRESLGAAAEGIRFHAVDGTDLLVPGTRLLDGITTLKSRLGKGAG